MADALRGRLEALAAQWAARAIASCTPMREQAAWESCAEDLREALAAPADVPPLPEGWKEERDDDDECWNYTKPPTIAELVIYDDGLAYSKAVDARTMLQILAHHLAKRP